MLWVSPKVDLRRRATRRGSCSATRRRSPSSTCGSRRSSPSSRRGCASSSRSASTASRATAATRSTSQGVEPVARRTSTRCSSRSAVVGALPHGRAAIFRAATVGLAAGAAGALGRRPAGRLRSGCSAAIVAAQTAGDERLPDLGLRRRRLPPGRPLTAEVFARWAQLGAVSPVHGGRRRRARTRRRGRSAPRRWARSGTRPSSTTSSSRYLYGAAAERTSRCCARSPTRYPDDAAVLGARPYELLVGPDLLAAPVVGPGIDAERLPPARARGSTSTPATAVTGGRVFTRPTPLDAVPVLRARRAPSSRSTCGPRPDSWWGVNEQTHPGRAGFLATNGADARPDGPAARRPALRSRAGSAAPRHARRPRRRLDVERRPAARASSSACTDRSSAAGSCVSAP